MSKKMILLLLSICLIISAVGCDKKGNDLTVDKGEEPVSSEQTSQAEIINPLTGMAGFSADKVDNRPVAIMINNLETAQAVQTGVGKADIVYETEVEGGITRLMAVFQDVSQVEKIGSIRSARYPYVDLALGHNAIYLHRGADPTYCKPHLKDIDDIDIDESNYGTRISNGLSSEHTLYTYGEKLWKGLSSDGYKIKNTNSETWVNFADQNAPISLANAANSVTVPFSTSYKTTFKYDSATSTYTRYFKNTERKDYFTKESLNFKNVFVLMTTIKDYSDNYHRQVYLESGDGYYFVNGTYTQIKWSKGGSKNGFKFTNTDGTELTVNPGNSWVCIANMSTSQPVIE